VTRMAAAARSAFLDAYRDGLGDRIALFDERLLRPLALRQVCREFIYAATHLPRWSYVPEAALPMLLEATQ
jgi:maltokinase